MKTYPVTKSTRVLVGAALLAATLSLQAQPTAHYVPGVEGLKAASLPPPGVYLRDYNVVYYADQINDRLGDDTGLDTKVFVYANVPRLIWITDLQVLGGNIGVDGLLPFQYTDVDIKAGPTTLANESLFRIGDAFGEATWSRHTKQFDFSLGFGVWAPTGEKASREHPAKPGKGFWTYMFTAGATWYPDTEKKWSVSALSRYEINGEQTVSHITPGQVYTVEGGISYAVQKTIDVGVVGYYQQQVTSDTGGSAADRARVAAIGPEINAFCPYIKAFTSLRYLYEFDAQSRGQGHTIALTLTKPF